MDAFAGYSVGGKEVGVGGEPCSVVRRLGLRRALSASIHASRGSVWRGAGVQVGSAADH